MILAVLSIVAASLQPAEVSQQRRDLSSFGYLIIYRATFVEEAECFGVPRRLADETIQHAYGDMQTEVRAELARKYGEAAVAEAEGGITFGAQCLPNHPPPEYRQRYVRALRELRGRLLGN